MLATTLRPHIWKLLSVGGFIFLILASAILLQVKPQAVLRSAIEVGSVNIGGKDEFFEPPDLLGRRISTVYSPAALLEMSQQGVSSRVPTKLEDVIVETAGSTLGLKSVVEHDLESPSKELHQRILDKIVEDSGWRMQLMRKSLAQRISLAQKSIASLQQQIVSDTNALVELKEFLTAFVASSITRARTALAKTAVTILRVNPRHRS